MNSQFLQWFYFGFLGSVRALGEEGYQKGGDYVCLFVVSHDANFGEFLSIRRLFLSYRVSFVDGTPRRGVE